MTLPRTPIKSNLGNSTDGSTSGEDITEEDNTIIEAERSRQGEELHLERVPPEPINLPINPIQPVQVMAVVPPLFSVKDTLSLIPVFDGYNIPLTRFLEELDIAKGLLPATAEPILAQLVRSKLRGDALDSIRRDTFQTINDIKKHFKNIFSPNKTHAQLQAELGGTYQKEDEMVLTYSNRILEIGNKILQAYKHAHEGEVGNDFIASNEEMMIECFTNGLKEKIEERMEKKGSIKEAITKAIEIEKRLNTLADVRRGEGGSQKKDSREKSSNQWIPRDKQGQPRLQCQYCHKDGHTVHTCRQIHYNASYTGQRSNNNQRPPNKPAYFSQFNTVNNPRNNFHPNFPRQYENKNYNFQNYNQSDTRYPKQFNNFRRESEDSDPRQNKYDTRDTYPRNQRYYDKSPSRYSNYDQRYDNYETRQSRYDSRENPFDKPQPSYNRSPYQQNEEQGRSGRVRFSDNIGSIRYNGSRSPSPGEPMKREEFCDHCKVTGHVIQDCRRKAWEEKSKNAGNEENPSIGAVRRNTQMKPMRPVTMIKQIQTGEMSDSE